MADVLVNSSLRSRSMPLWCLSGTIREKTPRPLLVAAQSRLSQRRTISAV
jgi:hypothetical protein